jgi:hypothetical protein
VKLFAAVDWRRAAAAQGHVQAQFALEIAFPKGRVFAQSDVEAARWYQKAADEGHVEAEYSQGACFTRAAAWRRPASRQSGGIARQLP